MSEKERNEVKNLREGVDIDNLTAEDLEDLEDVAGGGCSGCHGIYKEKPAE